MSVAPRAAPSMSERSRVLSRRGSNREEEELAVGAVIVMLSDKTEDQSAAYRPSIAIGDVGQDDSKSISTTSPQKEQRFVAVLAPSCDAAMASLLSQPPGTYLLVKEEDTAITVYVKFRQAVRALTLVKGKDVKKNDDAIHLAKSRKKDIDVLMQTPVHTLLLASEAYFLVEHCWKRFLPQVQAVVFELCCEPYLDEDTKLEDWNSSMIPADYSLALMPEACGFYILASHSAGPESASSAVIQVRQVEFDFNKFAITVADGTLKPSALLLSTSFSAKRTFEPYFTFTAIRDNFMSPDQVILKETSVSTTIPTQQTSLQNCIDLSSNDKELSILSAAEAACGSVMPHESLPETFVTVICEMHVHFTDVTTNLGANPLVKPAPWSAQKMKLVGRIIPILVELLIASAAFSEKKSPTEEMDVAAAASEGRKRQILAQFSYAMRFDILFMTARSEDSVVCRLTHQLCQLLGARMRLPSELVDFIRDLVALFPVFLRLFLRNQGISTLWKNLHHNDVDKDEVFRWIPRAFLDEWIVLSLKELLQVLDALNGVTKQTPIPMVKQLQYIRHIHESFQLPRQHGATDSFSSQPGIAKLTLAAPHSVPFYEDVPFPQHFLLLESGLHALAIVLLVSFVIVEPNSEIDEKICPRVSVPGHDTSTSDKPNELLWTLQQHLVAVEMDQRYFEALTLEMETLQAFVSTARLSAIRLMLRLLCPNRFDRNLYMNTSQTKSENALLHVASSKHSREYIAKGAFSTVYKQRPALPRPEAVAIKVVEHQRRTGELCAVSGLYNEVSILSKLRGDLAATQLVDFGNHHAEQNFEIVMEYCPCSLTEWRAAIDRSDFGTPFRSCLVMILRAFEEACHCLSRIHQAGVCHFDIKSDNILVRSSAQELSRRLLENDDEHEDDASNREFKAWLCIADFGESKLVNSHQLPVRTFTFSSFTSGSAFPVAVQRTEKSMSLSRTRGTEAIKSPEVLKIKGSEDAEVKVTLASDIWSLGCLLYELVTQELLFQNDDWAGLYAHLVVTQDQAVLRSDHRQKVFDALRPSSSDEEEVVTALTEICSKILCRDASKRPDLAAIVKHVHKLINDVYELPVTASDESFIISLYQSSGEASASADAHRSLVPALELFASPAPRSRRADANGVTVPVRFFWNFFLAAHITRTQDRQAVTSCVGNGHGPVSKDVLAMEAFEAKHEGDFVHFVYLAWHDNSAPPGGPDAHESLIEELYEDEHRTVFLLNPHLKASVETQLTSDVHLFQQLVQHAPHYFPVLQRRLREEAGCVVFVVLGKSEEDSKELQQVLTGMLLFFLRSAVAMTAFELLSCFARDCAQFFDYPRSEFLQHLLSYSTPVAEDTATSTVIQCRCGSSVLRVESSAMSDALATQRCTCQTSDKSDSECPSFHPFPLSVDEGSEDADDDVHPVDSMFEHDDCEEQLVHPIESRSRRGQEVPWLCVDAASVSRADGLAFRWSPAGPRLGSSDSTRSVGSGSERRMSRFGLLKRRASKTAGDASPRLSGKEEPHELLVRGLQRRGKPADADSPSSDKWELYECELCRLPICALSEGKVAVPLLHPRSSD
ncbi:hypothetical protein PF010_g19842 [Phytophthora fragariae]|uniref:Protein kinase domain-containing protein n=1 Tax=Phytophthora fragariae TaxID=53985 RepID=A0A6G0KGW9_9STRA|nr:hypothetical protein PF010_g19842 [Phytophthora fragariae]